MASIRKKIGEGVFYSSVGNFVIKIFAAVGYFLIVSKLSLHDYGVFILLVSIASPISAIVFLSYDRIFVSQYAQAKANNEWGFIKGLFKEYYVLSAVLLVVLLFASFLLRDLLVRYYDVYVIQFFWTTITFIVAQFMMNQVSLFLEANEKFKEISLIQIAESVSRVIMTIGVMYFLGLSINNVIFIYAAAKFISSGIGLVSAFPLLKNLRKKQVPAESGVVRKIFFTVGKWEIGKNIAERVIYPLKLFLIKFFVNIEGIAIFDFARNIYAFAISLLPVSKVIFPVIARNSSDKDKLYLIVSKAKKYTFLAYLPIFAAALIFTPPVLSIFFPQYIGGELIIYVTLLHFLTDVYKTGQAAFFYAFNRQRFIFFITPIFILSQVLLDTVFVAYLGVIGIVIAWHLNAFFNGLVYNIYIHRSIGIKKTSWRELFRFDDYDKLVLLNVSEKLLSFRFWKKNLDAVPK